MTVTLGEVGVSNGPLMARYYCLVAGATTQLGLPANEVQTIRRAGFVHDFDRLGVSNSIWDKPGPLGAGEWERYVRRICREEG